MVVVHVYKRVTNFKCKFLQIFETNNHVKKNSTKIFILHKFCVLGQGRCAYIDII